MLHRIPKTTYLTPGASPNRKLEKSTCPLTAALIVQVLGCWTRWPGDLGFLYQRFSSLLRNEACQFRNHQSRTIASCGQVLDKLDNFHLLLNITQSQCKSMREREIA